MYSRRNVVRWVIVNAAYHCSRREGHLPREPPFVANVPERGSNCCARKALLHAFFPFSSVPFSPFFWPTHNTQQNSLPFYLDARFLRQALPSLSSLGP